MIDPKSLHDFKLEELDRELIARKAKDIKEGHFPSGNWEETPELPDFSNRLKKLYAAPPAVNPKMSHLSTIDIITRIKELSRGQKKAADEDNHKRGIIGEDDRMDFYELEDALNNQRTFKSLSAQELLERQRAFEDMKNIKRNLDATAVICSANCLEINNGFASLRTRTLKERYGLCECERFANQLTALGRMCTCLLVKEDVVLTAGHFVNENKAEELRVVFGFKMKNADTVVTQIPIDNVYPVEKIIGKGYNRKGNEPDWALLKLDRKAARKEKIKLSSNAIMSGSPIYTLGHPAGLPLKFATGASIRKMTDNGFFQADLDIFMGNSGSPVFDRKTHELIGLVAHGYSTDFRWVDGCWVSVIYPTPDKTNEPGENDSRLSEGTMSECTMSECTMISAFREILDRL